MNQLESETSSPNQFTTASTRIEMNHGGNVEVLASKYGFEIDQITDFSANINPLGPPPETQEILEQSWQEITCYPDPNSTRLRSTLARWHKIDPENIVVGNGASELIYWIARLSPSPKALIFSPTFTEYARAVRLANGLVHHRIAEEQNSFQHPFSESLEEKSNEVDLIFIGNPNNPTGNLYSKSLLENWLKQSLRKNPKTIFIIDESFLPFVKDEENYSMISLATQLHQVIVLRSMTKIFSVPGLRLGYAISIPSTIQRLQKLMPVWRVNILAQRFGERIFSYSQFLKESVETLQDFKEELIKKLRKFPQIKVFDSFTNFVMVKIKNEQISALKLSEQLAENGVLVRNCSDFIGLENDRFIRFAVRKKEENMRLLSLLEEFFSHVS